MPHKDIESIERETYRVLAHYTRCIDGKAWSGLAEVFDETCVKERLGIDGLSCEAGIAGGAAIIADIAASLGRCGPTQHLLGNHAARSLDGGEVESLTYVRAFHRGAGSRADLWFEVMGEYRLRWRRGDAGWRVTRWSLRIVDSLGDPRAVSPDGRE